MGQGFGTRFIIPKESNEAWMIGKTAEKVITETLEMTGIDIRNCKSFVLTIQEQEMDGERNVPDGIIFEVRGELKDTIIMPPIPKKEN